jgi:hypothetical protein
VTDVPATRGHIRPCANSHPFRKYRNDHLDARSDQTGKFGSPVRGVSGEKIHDRPGEDVVAITGDHMSRAADIDEVNLGEA